MTEKTISTAAGPFTRERMLSLRKTLNQAVNGEGMERDQVIKWEGNDLLISYGQYLLEFVETEYAKRNCHGL